MDVQSTVSKETALLEAPVSEFEHKFSSFLTKESDNSSSFIDFLLEDSSEEESSAASPFTLPVILPTASFFSCEAKTPTVSLASSIPPSCLQVLDRLSTEMVVMHAESSNSTTLTLNGEAFKSSPFQGATVTIVEYSTAPKIFNVSITAQESAINLLHTHMASFFELLETRNFSFAIHRIDTHLSTQSRREGLDPVEAADEDDQSKEDT